MSIRNKPSLSFSCHLSKITVDMPFFNGHSIHFYIPTTFLSILTWMRTRNRNTVYKYKQSDILVQFFHNYIQYMEEKNWQTTLNCNATININPKNLKTANLNDCWSCTWKGRSISCDDTPLSPFSHMLSSIAVWNLTTFKLWRTQTSINYFSV